MVVAGHQGTSQSCAVLAHCCSLTEEAQIDNNSDDIMRLMAQAVENTHPNPRNPWNQRIVLGCWAVRSSHGRPLQAVSLIWPRQSSYHWPLDISPAIPSPTSASLHPTHANSCAFPMSHSTCSYCPSLALVDRGSSATPKLLAARSSSGR